MGVLILVLVVLAFCVGLMVFARSQDGATTGRRKGDSGWSAGSWIGGDGGGGGFDGGGGGGDCGGGGGGS